MAKFFRRQRKGIAAMTVLALLMTVLAVLHKGVPAAQLQLHDGGVWVTNQALKLVGHLNYPARTLDGGVRADSGEFDVSQAANTVFLHDTGLTKVQSVDTAVLSKGDGASVRDGLTLVQGGQVAVASDARGGKVWILDPTQVDTFNPEQDPTLDKLAGVRAIPGTDGVVHLVTPDGAVRKVVDGRAVGDGTIQGLADLATASLTVVGDTLVVLDRAGSSVRTTRGSVAVDAAAKLVLQQPGPANDRVLLAAADSYVWAPLGGGNATVSPNGNGAGTPAAPAYLDGCGYLAWSGSGAYVRDCATDADDQNMRDEKLAGFRAIAFRVNRDVIVLNDLANGSILLVNDKMRLVDNWKVIESSTTKQDDTKESTETTDELASPEKRATNTKPEAKDDDYGVRPGRTFTLPVLENDADADGDLLTASVKRPPTGATVAQLRGGEALSIAVPDDATGQYSFTYTANDGRENGTAEAKVTVKVFPSSVNEGPVQKRASSMKLGQKGEVSYSILPDLRDPESDPIFVTGIAEQPSGLSVKWRPDGVLTVKDLGTGGAGRREVKVLVSDGNKVSEGILVVTVSSEQLPPVANTDHVVALKDQDVVVRPLANDVDPLGGQLRLTTVAQAAAGQTVQPDYTTGLFTFKGSTPGTFYVSYQIANASSTPATGYVRVDVAEPAEGSPVAGDDIAMLPAGGSVVLDPLANDSDPSGGVLVLKSIDAPATAGMAVEIIDHHLLRISAPIGLKVPVDFPYTVSNGPGQATGRVTVLPLPPTGSATPPTAVNDSALVRLNDIVTIPVLGNDLSPSGLPLSIDPKVTIEGDAAAGDVFVSRDVVRFRAKKPGQFRVNYTVRDTASNYSTGQVLINVNPLEPLSNTPPLPQPISGRVLAGSKVVIPVPVNGIDPEGDSVSFVGLASGPSIGTAVATAEAIEYTAPEGATGTDRFTYEVADRFGEKNTSTVRVGIAPPNATNQSPVALPDDVATRPDRSLTVNATANDTDPDGDALTLVAGSVAPTDDKTTAAASIDKGRIKLKTPAEEATLHYYYGVSDGRGGSSKGVVTVKVNKDAVLKPPVARDDVVTEAQIKDKQSVEVEVLTNDYDPDGSVDDLQVSSDDPGVTAANGKLSIPVTDQRQVVLYTVKDVDENTAKAAVVVPPSSQGRPYIDETKMPLKVKAGELLTVPLADVVIVRAGHSPMFTFAEKAKAGTGADTVTAPVKDAHTLQFQATKDFAGLSSVTFEVTDGSAPDDKEGHTATLTVPIMVEAAAAVPHPPIFRGSDVTAGAGEAATVVDLLQMVTDEDPGDLAKLTFELGAVSPGFTVKLNGTKLEVSAPVDATPGTTGTAALTVTDHSTPAVPGTIQLKATASTRPLMSIKTAVVNDAKAGFPSTVDLSGSITNPFSDKNLPVTIVGSTVSGASGGQATFNGLVVTVTPPAGYHGQMLVTYTAQDGSNQPSRQVQGTIELTVRDKPDPPTAVTAETHLSKTATVSWSAGPNNGATIDKFTVKWSGGSKDCGQVTTCLIDTLNNDTFYTFTVTATNVVGESDPSAASNQVRPDVKPNPPGTPVGTFGDKQIAVTWAAAVVPDGGSSVKEYTVEISPAAGGSNTKAVTTTSLTWTGLTNGTAYTFRVLAKNDAIDPSGWSGSSTPNVPAGLPFQPAAPKAVKDPVSALSPSATISWTAPNGNGDANMTYEMRRHGTTNVLFTGTGLSQHVTMSVETADQTFEVRAQNKAGWGPWSPTSNGIRGFQTPGAVTGLTATATGANNTVTITFGASAGNGATASEMTYYWSAGGVTQSIPVGGGTVTSGAFRNGQNVAVAVYAVSNVKGETTQGTSTSTTVNAYGPPTSPSMSCGASGTSISCSWSGGNANGRNTNFVVSGDWSTANGGASGSHDFGNVGYSQTRSLCVQAVQDGGAVGGNNCNSARTQDPPPPTVTVSKGAKVSTSTCSTSSCAYIVAATANFNTSVTCSVGGWGYSWTQGGNATATSSPNYYGYPGTTVTVTCSGGGQTATGSMVWY